MNQSEQSQLEHSLDVLGAELNYGWDDIEKQYRQLVQRWHPDRNSSDEGDFAKNKFIEINSAYKYLRTHYLKTGLKTDLTTRSTSKINTGSKPRNKTGSTPHRIQPEQTSPLLGTKNPSSVIPVYYKKQFVIAGTLVVMIAVFISALLWSLDSRLAQNNRDRASIEESETAMKQKLSPSEPTQFDASKQSSADVLH